MKRCIAFLLCVILLAGCSFGRDEVYVPVLPAGEDDAWEDEDWEDGDWDEDWDEDENWDGNEDWDEDWAYEEEDESGISAPDIIEQYLDPEDDDLMNVRDVIANIPVKLRYAGKDNMAGEPIYDFNTAYLRYGTIRKLADAQQELWQAGYTLLIWDAFRPVWAQEKLYELFPDSDYVSDPKTGTMSHCRGSAVDVTLLDMDGNEVKMPTDFDSFTPKADRDYSDVPAGAAKNAQMLENVMVKYGFKPYDKEWWHFTDTDEYPVEEDFTPGAPRSWIPNCRDYISLRKAATVRSTAIAKIEKGQKVKLLEWAGTMAKVEYQGQEGYVLANYIMPLDDDTIDDHLCGIQFTDYYSYEDMEYDLEWLEEEFPDLVELDVIGQSEEGVDIPVMRIGNPKAKYNVLVQASMHGREHATGWLAMGLAANALYGDAEYLKNVCFHIIPMVNPDGVKISQDEVLNDLQNAIYQQDKGLKYTKESKSDYAAHWKANANGIDLNRNFPSGWEELKSRDYASFQWFSGIEPFCTAETRALRDYTLAHSFDATVSIHASGCLVYYGFGDKQPANRNSYALAAAISKMNGYDLVQTGEDDGGGYKDWAIDELGIPSVTIELGATLNNDRDPTVPLEDRDLYSTFFRNMQLYGVLADWVMNHAG